MQYNRLFAWNARFHFGTLIAICCAPKVVHTYIHMYMLIKYVQYIHKVLMKRHSYVNMYGMICVACRIICFKEKCKEIQRHFCRVRFHK